MESERKSEDTAQKGKNKKPRDAPFLEKSFGGPGELSPAPPPPPLSLCLPAGLTHVADTLLI